jgi:hypothetical protein
MRIGAAAAVALVALAGAGCSPQGDAGTESPSPYPSAVTDSAGPSDESTPADQPAASSSPTPQQQSPAPAETAKATPSAPVPSASPTTGATTAPPPEVPEPASVRFDQCSEEYLALTADLLPGGGITPSMLEEWATRYDDAAALAAGGEYEAALKECQDLVAEVEAAQA